MLLSQEHLVLQIMIRIFELTAHTNSTQNKFCQLGKIESGEALNTILFKQTIVLISICTKK